MLLDAMVENIALAATFDIPPLPDGCPWSGWTLPNLKWCEDNVCAWVTAPANTWSNPGGNLVGDLVGGQVGAGSNGH